MEIQKIQQAHLLDILFEGRNKEYGAYELRKAYNRRLTQALMVTGSVCLVLIGSYTLAGRLDKSPVKLAGISDTFTLAVVDPPVETPPAPKVRPIPMQQVAMINAAPPRILPDDQVKPEDVPKTQDDMEHVKLGTFNREGAPDDGIEAPPQNNGLGTGVTVAPEKKDAVDDGIWRSVEIEASYQGGMEAWKRFLLKNFHCPEQAIAEGTGGTVIVEFVVDKEGNVSNVQAISGPEVLRAEAVRVIKKSGKWNPGNQNGRMVNSYKKQPIVVQLQSE